MKTYKILLKLNKEDNKWEGATPKGIVQVGEVVSSFKFKNSADEIEELKKGDIVHFQDDYPHKVIINDKEFISTSPTNLIIKE